MAEVSLKVGDKVSEGDLVVLLDSEGQQPAPAVAGAGKSAAEEKDSAKPVAIEVRVPDIGDFSDVDVIEVLVQADQEIEAEDPLVTLETDKAAMDIPAPASGRILSLAIKEGDKVSEGDLVVTMLGVPVPSPASQQAPAPAPITDAERDRLRTQLLNRRKSAVQSPWVVSLREKADIEDMRSTFQQ